MDFIDLSSNNAPPDLPTMRRATSLLVTKATQGDTYVWAGHAALADEWHRLGGTVWHYHFGVPGISGAQQADWFLDSLGGHFAANDRVVFDAENSGSTYAPGEAAAVSTGFVGRVSGRIPQRGLIYGSPYFLRDNGVFPHAGWGLWIASYGAKIAFMPPGWARCDAWQYTDAGTFPGQPGQVDVSHLLVVPPRKPGKPTPPRHWPEIARSGTLDKATISAWQHYLNRNGHRVGSDDGVWDGVTVGGVQDWLGFPKRLQDGKFTPEVIKTLQIWLNGHRRWWIELTGKRLVEDGVCGPQTIKALQRFLNSQR